MRQGDNHDDAFSWGALNGSGLEVATVMGPNEFGLTVAELSAMTGRHPQTIRKALKRLEEVGMAKVEPKTWPRRWTFTVRDLKEVARELGVDGRGARRKARFASERAAYGEVIRRRKRKQAQEPDDETHE